MLLQSIVGCSLLVEQFWLEMKSRLGRRTCQRRH
jgi:hypothetical protein